MNKIVTKCKKRHLTEHEFLLKTSKTKCDVGVHFGKFRENSVNTR